MADPVTNLAGTPVDESAIEEFRRSLGGDLVRAGDPDYESARQVYNAMIDKHPALIARCAGPADVIAAVNFARAQNLEISVRGGGHNVAGNALCDNGLTIDLSRMRGVWVDPINRRARAQGGCLLADLDRETQVFGLAAPIGTVSETGIAGLTLGGGIGWLMRKHGLACDNLISADVVTAAGQLVRASETENPDLYWAIRGGGGNFGIVTSFEYQLYPVGPIVYGGMLLYPRDQAPSILKAWREFSQAAPEEVGTALGLLYSPDGHPVTGILVCYNGDPKAGEELVRPLREVGTVLADLVQPLPYRVMQSLLDEGFGRGFRQYWKSSFLTELDTGAIETIVANANAAPSPLSATIVEHLGGALARVPVDATAFEQRTGEYNLLIVSRWATPSDDEPNIAWARNFFQAIRPYAADSVYVNYLEAGAEGAERLREAYRVNYDRLVEVKTQYDPTNLFHLNQNIAPTV